MGPSEPTRRFPGVNPDRRGNAACGLRFIGCRCHARRDASLRERPKLAARELSTLGA
jgi:hypothetical protein